MSKAKRTAKKAAREEKKAAKKAAKVTTKSAQTGSTNTKKKPQTIAGKILKGVGKVAKKAAPIVAGVGLSLVGAGAVAPKLVTKVAASKVGQTGLGKMVTKAMGAGSIVREKISNTLKKNGQKADLASVKTVEEAIQVEAKKRGKRLPIDKVSKSNTESAEQFARLQLKDLNKLERQAKKAAKKGSSNAADVLSEVRNAKNAAKAASIAQKLNKEGQNVNEEMIFRELEEIEVRGSGSTTITPRIAELASDLDTKTLAVEKVPFLGKVIDTVSDVFEKTDNIQEKFSDFKEKMGLGSMSDDYFSERGNPDIIEAGLNSFGGFNLKNINKKTVLIIGGVIAVVFAIFYFTKNNKKKKW